jgi:predicted metal-binding membrane protein
VGTPLASLLGRDRLIVAACLAAATALAWVFLWRMSLAAPGHAMAGMAMAPDISWAWFAGAFGMWALMMVAMMLPSASPMILFYAKVVAGSPPRLGVVSPTLVFAASYLIVWFLFSLLAAALQGLLIKLGVVSAAALAVGDRRLAGALLIAAGLYQVTPLKQACLDRCRSPLSFVMRLWRPGWRGAVRLGVIHGLYCLGCCWMLMALLFVGGVMNLAWVAALALIVLIEKVAPIGVWGSRALGVAAIAAGGLLILGAPAAG